MSLKQCSRDALIQADLISRSIAGLRTASSPGKMKSWLLPPQGLPAGCPESTQHRWSSSCSIRHCFSEMIGTHPHLVACHCAEAVASHTTTEQPIVACCLLPRQAAVPHFCMQQG